MEDELDILEKQSLLEGYKSKNEDFNLAQKQRKELADLSNQRLVEYYDKILYFSGGSFSFAVALVNLVATMNRTAALGKTGLLFPNVYWMYASAACFLASCGAVLISKKLDSYYISEFGFANYLKKGMDLEESKVKVFPLTKDLIVLTDMGNVDEEIANAGEKLKKINPAHERSKMKRDTYFWWMRFCRGKAEALGLTGSFLLFVFTIQLIQALIWG